MDPEAQEENEGRFGAHRESEQSDLDAKREGGKLRFHPAS